MNQLKSSFPSACRKIIGVGRNYKAHALELGNAVPSSPFFFLKPPSSIIREGSKIVIPSGCKSLHHEVELGVVIGKSGKRISRTEAQNHIDGYVLALDMTARDFQESAKKQGRPWALAKGFDTSCPISDLIAKDRVKSDADLELWLKVNGEVRQRGNTKDMVFSVDELIEAVSEHFKLEQGDLILTGTPEGVDAVQEGDVIEAEIPGLVAIRFEVAQ